ncbi:tripartite tricarboxylate transporter permease [Tropicimonas sp. IMCC34043]|uniref:tripartite tricarboxylate transporter permease n=1 Tax=Tropicimonas sp. IMCC34043 TaxID=2248760 RepID=UPI000E27A60E|nr:tripartite tricarboxylate transporter permease [Tropicimonas sp. IMCC34043]
MTVETASMVVLGTFLGILVGAPPGLSSGMAVAVLLPFTFNMDPLAGIVFLTSVYVAVAYGGSITAIMLNTPGAPENAATAADGYALTRSGRSAEALGTAICASAIGGLLSYFAMLFGIDWVADIALSFGAPEIFLIAMSGVMILGAVGTGSPAKILASVADSELVRTMQIYGDGWPLSFIERPISAGITAVMALAFGRSAWLHWHAARTGRRYISPE